MKNEIKEILDNFKIYEDRYKKCNETQFIIFYRDIHLLLDYITTLQEENEKYKLIIKALQKHYTDREYYEDNEFLKQLLSVTKNDMIWLKRIAGEENKQ